MAGDRESPCMPSHKHQVPDKLCSSYDSCVCYKPNGTILCKFCGFLCQGRLKKTCTEHPSTIYLMDIAQCPQCRAYGNFLVQLENTSRSNTPED